jgi:Lrp/AsnC family leucine-responsive transcriptional regulator
VIEKDVSILSPEAVGRPLLLFVEVLMERESTEPIDRFKRLVVASDEVCQCYYVTGRATFMLLLTMRDMAEYDGFIRRNFFDNPDVKTFETIVVIDCVKMGFELPLR